MMPHNEVGSKEDLARYKIEMAKSTLKSAITLREIQDYRGANNRAYYAIYYAVSAVHALEGNRYRRMRRTICSAYFTLCVENRF